MAAVAHSLKNVTYLSSEARPEFLEPDPEVSGQASFSPPKNSFAVKFRRHIFFAATLKWAPEIFERNGREVR